MSQKWDEKAVKAYLENEADVSRETLNQLETYVALLVKWQSSINLIANSTIANIWERHILDSAQLVPYLPKVPCRLLDCGTGAGLPAMILAILTDHHIEMVESDSRKCAFLQTALRETGNQAVIHNERLETLSFRDADIITARAFAPLDRLMQWCQPQQKQGQSFWLLKGRGVNEELTKLPNSQTLKIQQFPSLLSGEGIILNIALD